MARWSVPSGITVYAIPRVLQGVTAESDWNAPTSQSNARSRAWWYDFNKYMESPEDDGLENPRWDGFAKRTNVTFEFLDGDSPYDNAVPWPIDNDWFYVSLLNKDEEFAGFLVAKADCVELPF